MLATCLTLFTVAEKAIHLYDWFTGVTSGSKVNPALAELEKKRVKVERLSDRLLYAPDVQQAVSLEGATTYLSDARQVRTLLNPVAESLQSDVLSTAVVSTPPQLKKAFQKDPWEVLIEVRPADRVKPPLNPDLIPIVFFDQNRPYIGWQTRGALPSLFGCEFHDDTGIWTPSGPRVEEARDIVPAAAPKRRTAKPRLPAKTPVATPRPDAAPDHEARSRKVLEILSRHASGSDFHVSPGIPPAKLANAAASCEIPKDERMLALIDCTIFGSAKNCLAFCTRGIYFHNGLASPVRGFIPYEEFPQREFKAHLISEITFGNHQDLDVSGSGVSKHQFVAVLQEIRRALQ